MITNTNLKVKLIGLGLLCLLILGLIVIIILSAFRNSSQPVDTALSTPTPVATQPPKQFDRSHITPLQKTTIDQTTDQQIVKDLNVVSKTNLRDITIYKVKSAIPGVNDEVRTKDGKVIFESSDTEISSPPPPKMTTVTSTFGEPELIQKSVGVGWYTDAYLYPTQGLAFFANSQTGTVYLVQRFVPMTLNNYRSQYSEFLQKKSSQPEYFK
ncbi:hypothetical protein BH09PAT1_BH09PAT1_1330 [soil metagenome]